MSKRIFQIVAIVVLTLAALTPLMECFDHWDRNPRPVNDTEIHLTAWFVGVGIVLVLSKVMRRSVTMAVSKMERREAFATSPTLRTGGGLRVEATGSPPLIPLRI